MHRYLEIHVISFFKTDGIFVVKSTMFLGMGVKHEARGSLRRNIYTYMIKVR